jgi:GDP-L-fucose synthase
MPICPLWRRRNITQRILLLGSGGFVGSTTRKVIGPVKELLSITREDVDLRDVTALTRRIKDFAPDVVINAAGSVAGIQGNIDHPVDLMLANSDVSAAVMRACHQAKVSRMLQFASACVYPLNDYQALSPEALGSGIIERTSASYATSKIFAMELASAFNRQYGYNWITLIPTNLYGPGDWNHGSGGHVIAMLTERFLVAKRLHEESVNVWGDGQSLRNFLFIDDLAHAVDFLIERPRLEENVINLSSDEEVSIRELANRISALSGFEGEIIFDTTKPNGARRKLLDDSYLRSAGWKPSISLDQGLQIYLDEFSARL